MDMKIEEWFYRRMVDELKEMMFEQKTDSIKYIIGMLEHEFEEILPNP